jgi:hypothetical protein
MECDPYCCVELDKGSTFERILFLVSIVWSTKTPVGSISLLGLVRFSRAKHPSGDYILDRIGLSRVACSSHLGLLNDITQLVMDIYS